MEKSFDSLSGARGLVYLLMVGRRLKASDIWSEIEQNNRRLNKAGLSIVKRRPTIYGYVRCLERAKLIKSKRRRGRGNPTDREADMEIIFDTLNEYGLFREKRERRNLELLLKHLDGLIRVFPLYLLAKAPKGIRALNWQQTLSIFLEFNVRVVESCHKEPSYPADVEGVTTEGAPEALQKLKRSLEREEIGKDMYRALSRNILRVGALDQLRHEIRGMHKESIDIMRSLARNPDDVYKPQSFLFNLYLASIMLINPECASEIYAWAIKLAEVTKASTS